MLACVCRSEFVARASPPKSAEAAPAPRLHHYLYGEPLSAAWQSALHVFQPPCVDPAVQTSCLLWVAVDGSCSPLHYDLSEGMIMQVCGQKQVVLIPPGLTTCYPHPIAHPHDRQSQLNDCKAPDLARFPDFAHATAFHTTLDAGDCLYIPYGWWHEITSEGESISITIRWDPYKEEVRKLMLAKHRLYKSMSSQTAAPSPATHGLAALAAAVTDQPPSAASKASADAVTATLTSLIGSHAPPVAAAAVMMDKASILQALFQSSDLPQPVANLLRDRMLQQEKESSV
jgi:hypothetical protein